MSFLADQVRHILAESPNESDHDVTDEAIVLAMEALSVPNALPQGVTPVHVARVAGAVYEAFHMGLTIAGALFPSAPDADALQRILERRAEYQYGGPRNWTRNGSRSKWFQV